MSIYAFFVDSARGKFLVLPVQTSDYHQICIYREAITNLMISGAG